MSSVGAGPRRLTLELCRKLTMRKSTVIFDADGVLWNEHEPVSGAQDTVKTLRALNKTVLLLTNSAQSRRSCADKCVRLGFPEFTEDRIVSASAVLAHHLKVQGVCADGGKAYVIGFKGLTDELDLHGIEHVGVGPDHAAKDCPGNVAVIAAAAGDYELDVSVRAVVSSWDPHFSMVKLQKACEYLWNPQCKLLATSHDPVTRGSNGRMYPCVGTILAAIETGSGRTATVVGKPNRPTWTYIGAHFGVSADDCVMIGDSLLTDIAFARQHGLASVLVLSGVTNEVDLTASRNQHCLPDLFCDSLQHFNQLLMTSP